MKLPSLPPALADRWSIRRTAALLLDPTRPAWTSARLFAAVVDVDPATARAWLPPGLKPRHPARATLFIAWYPETSFGVAYHEAGILLQATHRGRDVLHCPWMLVDDDTALVLGRELVGFPKKLGAFTHALADDGTGAASAARGSARIALTARDARPATLPAVFTDPLVNVVASPMLGFGVLWRMHVPERVHRAHAVVLDLAVGGSAFDPLDRLGIGARTVPGLALVMDLAVPPALPSAFVPPLRPVGLVPPTWLYAHLPFRTL